ncbi:MAG: DUF433 domain-containing protein [Caulobacterales bacterium]
MPPLPGNPRISKDPEIVTGQPRITGTRISVDLLKRNVAAGMSEDMLLRVYPVLTKEDVKAALTFGDETQKA